MQSKQKSIVVTGGRGAIGSNLVKRLQASGEFEIHVLDNLSSGQNELPEGVQFTNIDISNNEKLANYFERTHPEIIFHLAAHFANQNSVDHPISDTATNLLGLINLLELQRRNGSLEKFVFASSSCVYGNRQEMSETDEVMPYDTPYAINKYAGELYCRYYSSIQGVPIVCGRIFNNFGPGEEPGAYRNVIPNFIAKALRNEDIFITGTGEETRDFTYVDDTVDFLVCLVQSEYRNAEVFNSGTGVGTSIKDLAETIVEVTGSSSTIRYTEPRSWDVVKHRRSNITKSQTLLGYQPKRNFRQNLKDTVLWIRERIEP